MYMLLVSLDAFEVLDDPHLQGFLIENNDTETVKATLDSHFSDIVPKSFRKNGDQGRFQTLGVDEDEVDWVFQLQEATTPWF